MAEMCELALWL